MVRIARTKKTLRRAVRVVGFGLLGAATTYVTSGACILVPIWGRAAWSAVSRISPFSSSRAWQRWTQVDPGARGPLRESRGIGWSLRTFYLFTPRVSDDDFVEGFERKPPTPEETLLLWESQIREAGVPEFIAPLRAIPLVGTVAVQHVALRSVGLPLAGLQSSEWSTGSQASLSPINWESSGSVQLPYWPSAASVVTMPWMPVWPGFAVDTVWWGCAWFFVPRGALAARAWHRRRRGRCGYCNYNVAGHHSLLCPECGAAQKQSSESTAGLSR